MVGKKLRDADIRRMLRELRDAEGWTQANLAEKMAEISRSLPSRKGRRPDAASVSKIERGLRPLTADWLNLALQALDPPYRQRQAIMDAAGFAPPLSLPDREDIAWARAKAEPLLNHSPYPAYLADCALRVLHFNEQFARFDPQMVRRISKRLCSIVELVFGNRHPVHGILMPYIANPEEYFSHMIRVLHYQWQAAQDEPWYREMLPSLLTHELFRREWDAAQRGTPATSKAARPDYTLRLQAPLRLRVPTDAPDQYIQLSFNTIPELFTEDRRFRTVIFIPTDRVTLLWCAEGIR